MLTRLISDIIVHHIAPFLSDKDNLYSLLTCHRSISLQGLVIKGIYDLDLILWVLKRHPYVFHNVKYRYAIYHKLCEIPKQCIYLNIYHNYYLIEHPSFPKHITHLHMFYYKAKIPSTITRLTLNYCNISQSLPEHIIEFGADEHLCKINNYLSHVKIGYYNTFPTKHFHFPDTFVELHFKQAKTGRTFIRPSIDMSISEVETYLTACTIPKCLKRMTVRGKEVSLPKRCGT